MLLFSAQLQEYVSTLQQAAVEHEEEVRKLRGEKEVGKSRNCIMLVDQTTADACAWLWAHVLQQPKKQVLAGRLRMQWARVELIGLTIQQHHCSLITATHI